jgi:hypothetical protein
MIFLAAIYRAGGFDLVNKVYGHPPSTTEQVIHPEKYLKGEGAIAVREPEAPPGFEKVLTGTVGQLQTNVILGFCLPAERASSAARGWGGDAYAVLAHPSGSGALLWSTAWDNEQEAKEFEAALRDYVTCTRARSGTRIMPLDDVVVRQSARVALVRGIPQDDAEKLAANLLTLPSEPKPAVAPFGPIEIPAIRQAHAFRPAYISGDRYVNEQLGLLLPVPPAFSYEMPNGTTLILRRDGPSPAVIGMLISDQIASQATVDEVHGQLAKLIGDGLEGLKLDYLDGRQVGVGPLGTAIERRWVVRGTRAGLKALVIPMCQSTGSLVLWGLWADLNGLASLDWWLRSVGRLSAAEPPICAELNP